LARTRANHVLAFREADGDCKEKPISPLPKLRCTFSDGFNVPEITTEKEKEENK
jgi:hypothetical protein